MLSTILPIVLLIALGMLCKKKQIMNEDGAEVLKSLSVKFLWPVVLFYAFFSAEYNANTIYYALIVFVLLTGAFLLAKVSLRKTVKSHSFILPYLTVGSEIGMLGYSLYVLLFGAENVYRLALFDVGHALFIFPIFLGTLNAEQGKASFGASMRSMARSPLIIMLVIGLLCGVTGLGGFAMRLQAAETIRKIYDLATSANIVMILISMGYSISFSGKQLRECIRFVLIRVGMMLLCTFLGLLFIQSTVGMEQSTACALILTFMLPPVYMLSVYVKDKEEKEFATTMTSVYTVFTLVAFLVMTIIVK